MNDKAPTSMFDPMMRQRTGVKPAANPTLQWTSLALEDLVKYRDEITDELVRRGETSLKGLDMEAEMILQYRDLRRLQQSVIEDESVAASQRAQVANSVGSCQARLAELQMQIYSSERVKRMESALGKALDKLPQADAEAFLDHYARLLDQK